MSLPHCDTCGFWHEGRCPVETYNERPDAQEWEWRLHSVNCGCDYCREALQGKLLQESQGGYGE